MINGFENETKGLTADELKAVPFIVSLIRGRHAGDAITSGAIIDIARRNGHRLSGPRLRKMINFIRTTGRLRRLIATSSGYYIAANDEELRQYIVSLRQRAEAINFVADCLLRDLIVREVQTKLFDENF